MSATALDIFLNDLRARRVDKAQAAAFFAACPDADKPAVLQALQSLVHAPAGSVEAAARLRGVTTNQTCTPEQRAFIADFVAGFEAKTRTSKRLAATHRRELADQRTPANFNMILKEIQYPITLQRAFGAYVQDIDGNQYIDISGDFGVNLFGHAPSFLTSALKAQVDAGLSLSGRYADMAEAATIFCGMTGHDRVAFCQSGTEAVMSAVRLARAYTDRQKLVVFNNAYHGHADPFLNIYTAGVSEAAAGEAINLTYGAEASLEQIEQLAPGLAAVLVEPVQSEHLDLQPVEFLRRLREITSRHGVVLIFDEMITGFRAHPRGCQGLFGVEADLATYGKIIGGGITAGAVAGRAPIMDWSDGGDWKYGDGSKPGPTTYIAGTHTQNPLRMAATRAVLRELKARSPDLQADLTRRTAGLVARLNEFLRARGVPVDVLVFASQFRFRFQTRAFTLTQALFLHLLNDAGVRYYLHGNCFLTAAHTDDDVEAIYRAVCDVFSVLLRQGFFYQADGSSSSASDAESGGRNAVRGRSEAPPAPGCIEPATPQSATALERAPPVVAVDPDQVAQATAELKQVVGAYLELALHEFDVDDDLADLGVDSIILAGILKAATERFGVRISLKRLGGANTIAAVAEALCRAIAEGDDEGSEDDDAVNHWEGEGEAKFEDGAAAKVRGATPAASPLKRAMDTAGDDDVAIVGLAVRAPGAGDAPAFFANLLAGATAVTEVPADRWAWQAVYDPEGRLGATRSRWGGFLDDHDKFDPLFFKISPREAKYMDPQERLLLMQAHAALEDAAIKPSSLAGSRTGVFVGYEFTDYFDRIRGEAHTMPDLDPGLASLSGRPYLLANRVSFALDLKGPSEALNVNCASSAVAIHRACQSLLAGESDLALAGGVSLNLSPQAFVAAGDLLSPDGASRVFDSNAAGFAKSEGCVVLVLKRLADALRDGDSIYALLKGAYQTYRGQGASLSEVRSEAIAEVVSACHRRAGVEPTTVAYVEVDGYATLNGDAAEFAGLKAAMGEAVDGKSCALGSLKPNLGNLEPVSGAISTAKVALALRNGVFPATVGVETLNPAIDFAAADHPLYLLDKATPLASLRRDGPVRAGVNSFADSGVNVHLVLEERPPATTDAVLPGPHVFLVSARSEAVRDAYVRAWIERLEAAPELDLAALAYSVQRGRDSMAFRLAIVAESTASLLDALRAVADGRRPPNAWLGASDGAPNVIEGSSDLGRNAAAWTAGGEVDWMALWMEPKPPVLNGLPTYPFTLKRCWLDFGATTASTSQSQGAADSRASPLVPVAATAPAQLLASPPFGDAELMEYTGSDILTIMRGLRMIVAAFLEIGPEEPINEDANFSEIGLTSMSIVAFIEEVNRRFHLELPEIAVFDYPNLEELAAHIASVRETRGGQLAAPPPRVAPPTQPAARLDLQAILIDLAKDSVTVDEALQLIGSNA